MPEDAEVKAPAPASWRRVQEMQAKLHRWAAADPGCRFGDLYNLVCDPATLLMAWDRVAGNTGARTAGVDRYTVRDVAGQVGVEAFLADVREHMRGAFGVRRKRPTRFVIPAGSARMDLPDRIFSIPGLLASSGAKLPRTARCSEMLLADGFAVASRWGR